MARKKESIGEIAEELLRKNGQILTGFTCLLIIMVGVTLVNDPSRWWVSLAAVALFGAVVFLFLNARVLIKATVALLATLMEAAWAFKIGSVSDYQGSGGTAWMLSILISFFTVLAISYTIPSSRSRWGTATMTTTASFFFVYLVAVGGFPLSWAALVSGVLNVAFFILIYRFGRKSSYKILDMPMVNMDEDVQEKIISSVKEYGWGAVPTKGKLRGGVLIWNQRNAFVLSTVNLPQKFGISFKGRRAKGERHLTYNGKNINPWLMNIAFQMIPYWRTKGADIMLVLLDRRDGNGKEAKTIGVQLPDTKGRVPVGIMPAQHYLERNKFPELAKAIEEEFGGYVRELTPRQLKALDMMLPEEAESDQETDK